MKLRHLIAATASVAALALASTSASASTTFAWTAGSDGDIWGTAITPTVANTISWAGTDTYYFGIPGPAAHSHGQDMTWTMSAIVNGVSETIFSQTITGGGQTFLSSLGTLGFAGGTVTEVDLSCVNCSGNTYHQFGNATFTLGSSAPEPAAWALMLVGLGGLGGALRLSRKSASAAA